MLGYATPREQFPEVLGWFAALFLLYYFLVFRGPELSAGKVIGYGLCFRLVLFMVVPVLSDDVYRFIWDGRLMAHGFDPFLHLPRELVGTKIAGEAGLPRPLYEQLNSRGYYSVYPPVSQFLFGMSSWLAGQDVFANILILRGFVLAAEAGSMVLLLKALARLGVPLSRAAWFVLNPLVIVTVTGSLHFEGIMVGFLLWAFLELLRGREKMSAVAFGLSVATKLIPLVVLPFFIRRLGWKRTLVYTGIAGGTFLVLFLPFIRPELLAHFGSSLDLYFRKFEFNASVYYLVRWLGFQTKGYNIIQQAGPVLSMLTLAGVLFLATKERGKDWKSFLSVALLALTLHYLLATTVHPWYVVPLVLLGTLSGLRFPLVWSALIVLSYQAYAGEWQSSWWLVLEYAGLGMVMLWERRSFSFLSKRP